MLRAPGAQAASGQGSRGFCPIGQHRSGRYTSRTGIRGHSSVGEAASAYTPQDAFQGPAGGRMGEGRIPRSEAVYACCRALRRTQRGGVTYTSRQSPVCDARCRGAACFFIGLENCGRGPLRNVYALMPALLRSVYFFLSCIQIVVVGKQRPFLWITAYTSSESGVYVYRKRKDEVLVRVDDSSLRRRGGMYTCQVVRIPSPSQPQAAHTKPMRLSTKTGAVIHIGIPAAVPVGSPGDAYT